MVPVVDLVDVLSVGDVLLLVFACHGSRWTVHHPVQLVEEFVGLLRSEVRTWFMQESAWNLDIFSED